jgi:DNA-binding response OmpR family regulator
MKAIIVGADQTLANFVIAGMRLRWPDVEYVVATEELSGLEIVISQSADVLFLHGSFPYHVLTHTIRELRRTSLVPLVVLAERWEEIDVVTALDLGADDCIRMPCPQREIAARVSVLLRRLKIKGTMGGKTGVTGWETSHLCLTY